MHAYGFGWWKPFPKDDLLLNRVSGQRLRRLGSSTLPDDLRSDGWIRFEYQDDEVVYPVLAQLRDDEYRDPLWNSRRRMGRVLTVDHNRSAGLWQAECGADSATPPYGLWRRVDDCLSDALPCWPRMKSRDRALAEVRIRGGWLNGAWHSGYHRAFATLTPVTRKWIKSWDAVQRAERPVIVPIDADPPSPWCFFGFPSEPPAENHPPPELSERVKLAGMTEVAGPMDSVSQRVWIVPAGLPLTGMEGKTAYMRSADGQRVLYPRHGTTMSQQFGGTQFIMAYADSDFMGYLPAVNGTPSPLAEWTFKLDRAWGACRHDEAKSDLWFTVSQGYQKAPSYTLAQRILIQCINAWLFWDGTDARNKEWIPMLSLAGASSVVVAPHYLGGIWPAGRYCVASLDQTGAASQAR